MECSFNRLGTIRFNALSRPVRKMGEKKKKWEKMGIGQKNQNSHFFQKKKMVILKKKKKMGKKWAL